MIRRIVFGLAGAAVLIAAGAVAAARAPADGAATGQRLIAEITRATGLDIRANGPGEIDLFPSPRVRVRGVSVSRRGETPFAVAREVVGALKILPLLQGRVELGDVTLLQPEIAVDRLPRDEALDAVRGGTSTAGAPSIRLSDARLVWRGTIVDRVEAGLVWPRDGGPLTLSGYGRHAGRAVEATVQLADLGALARSERASFRAHVAGGGARLNFDGEVSASNGLAFAGEIGGRAESIADTLGWLGLRERRGGGPERAVSLTGRGALDASGLSVSNAELDLGGETMLGAARLTLAADGRPNLEATLDAERLDMNAYFGALAPELVREDGAWSASSIDLGGLAGWSLDLRLSAESAALGAIELGPTAATVAIAKGGLDLSIGEAAAYGGTLGGRLVLEPQGLLTKVRIEGASTDVAIHDLLRAMLPTTPIAGGLTGEFALEGAGASMAELVASLDGRATARLADGALDGASRSRTLALAGLRGRIDFDRAEARMRIERGVVQADEISMVGPAATFALNGTASLVDRVVALKGVVKPAERGWSLPVVIEGPLAAPKLRPDLGGRGPRGEASRPTTTVR